MMTARIVEPRFEILPKGDSFDPSLYVVGFSTDDTSNFIIDIIKEVYDCVKHIHNPNIFYYRVAPTQKIRLCMGDKPQPNQWRFCVDEAIMAVPNGTMYELITAARPRATVRFL